MSSHPVLLPIEAARVEDHAPRPVARRDLAHLVRSRLNTVFPRLARIDQHRGEVEDPILGRRVAETGSRRTPARLRSSGPVGLVIMPSPTGVEPTLAMTLVISGLGERRQHDVTVLEVLHRCHRRRRGHRSCVEVPQRIGVVSLTIGFMDVGDRPAAPGAPATTSAADTVGEGRPATGGEVGCGQRRSQAGRVGIGRPDRVRAVHARSHSQWSTSSAS